MWKRQILQDEEGGADGLGGGAGAGAVDTGNGAPTGTEGVFGDYDIESAQTELSESLFGPQTAAEQPTSAPEQTEAPAAPEATAAPGQTEEPGAAPPKTWRPEAAAKWASLPPEVRAEIAKREEDAFRGIEEYKAKASFGSALQQVFNPYMPLIEKAGINPVNLVANFAGAHYTLATGTQEQKLALISKLIVDYGIKPPGAAEDSGEAFTDPAVKALQSKLQSIESEMSNAKAAEAAAAKQRLSDEISAFAADPAHPYFDEVANDIAVLLRGGAPNLKEAYEKAIWANPVTRAKEQARVQAETAAAAKKAAEEKAAAARKATQANVKSKAKAASGTAPLGTIDDTLMSTLREIKSRS